MVWQPFPAGKGNPWKKTSRNRSPWGVIEACAGMICNQIRIARIDAAAVTPQQRMTLACLMDQLRRITAENT